MGLAELRDGVWDVFVAPRPALALAVPRMPAEVRLGALRVGCGAPRRGSVRVVGQGHAGVVGVPRVGLEGGCSMAVVAAGVFTGVHPLVAVGTATPRRWAITAMPRAAAAGRDLYERRGLYRRWYLGSGSPSDSEVAVRST